MACVVQQKDARQWFAELSVDMDKVGGDPVMWGRVAVKYMDNINRLSSPQSFMYAFSKRSYSLLNMVLSLSICLSCGSTFFFYKLHRYI